MSHFLTPKMKSRSESFPIQPPLKKKKVVEVVKTKLNIEKVSYYQRNTNPIRMVCLRPGDERIHVITKCADETFMSKYTRDTFKIKWRGPYQIWKDVKYVHLAHNKERGTYLVMIVPGENEVTRIFNKERVHKRNDFASMVIATFCPDMYPDIYGIAFILEIPFDDDEYEEEDDDFYEKDYPFLDINDDYLKILQDVDDEEDS